jgi:hypothetical protein
VVLLLPVRDAGRKAGDVPVQMGVALLAAEGEQVGALGFQYGFHGESNLPHDQDRPGAGGLVEVADGVFEVGLGGDEDCAGEGGPAVEEGDVVLGTPSAVRRTSISTASAPARTALRSEGRVFSRCRYGSPRWATAWTATMPS